MISLFLNTSVDFLNRIGFAKAHVFAYSVRKGTADETSFMQAIFTAVDITRHRACYDKAHATPLPHHNIQHEKPAGERKRFPAEAQ